MKKIVIVLLIFLSACSDLGDLGPWLYKRLYIAPDINMEIPLDYWKDEKGFEVQHTFDGELHEYFIITPIKNPEPYEGILNFSYNARDNKIKQIFIDMTEKKGKEFLDEIDDKLRYTDKSHDDGTENWIFNDLIMNVSYLPKNKMYSFFIYSKYDQKIFKKRIER